ncbi:MAG TPA: addiction module protein [Prolixibacteraceae bacterium]|nr:addiction module protein [Prolixibacteraceae bacterium]
MDTQHILLNIPLSFKQVVELVKQLSTHEKQQLSEVLRSELNTDDLFIPEEHKEIVRERIRKYENNPDSYISWNDIERKMSIGE